MVESEPSFLTFHAGISDGKTLKKDNNYFGTALNIASRVASYARGGQILCTENVVKQSKENAKINFICLGETRFKNITRSLILYEVLTKGKKQIEIIIDPVCKMQIDKNTPKAQLTFRN